MVKSSTTPQVSDCQLAHPGGEKVCLGFLPVRAVSKLVTFDKTCNASFHVSHNIHVKITFGRIREASSLWVENDHLLQF